MSERQPPPFDGAPTTNSPHPTGEHPHRHSIYEPEEFLDAPVSETIPERQVSLARRVLNLRTIGSIVFGIVLIYLLVRVLGANLDRTLAAVSRANPALLLAAAVAYYLTFPLRGFRWAYILRRVGTELPLRPSIEIVFLSWFVNCVVPAKLGDLYRAYLLKGNYGAPISRTVGTIFIERIADIVVIFALALAAGFWSFRGRNRPEVDTLFLIGFLIAVALVVLVVALRFQGRRLTAILPSRIGKLYESFHHGSTGALTLRTLPVIGAATAGVWLLEGLRVYFVIKALAIPAVGLGISSSVFVALAASLLTAVPLTPAGIGFVQAGVVGALTLYGVAPEFGLAVAAVDWGVSILTVIIIGGVLYALSGMVRRAHLAGVAGSGAEPQTPG
ncbi:MAG: hypothetical protein DLM71_06665 [Chloroflexi bacterium]|nr:MAG: hypothetical protein DLM71_06665 [Chloroflexota bacterium]